MAHDLIVPGPEGLLPEQQLPSQDRIRANRAASKAVETKRAIEKNWSAFAAWCVRIGAPSLPADPGLVEAYLVHLADDHPVRNRAGEVIRHGLQPASVLQALWAIGQWHRLAGHPSPAESQQVRTAMAGIRRRKAHRPKQQAPLTIDQIAAIPFKRDLRSVRDKALLLVGFAGCFRRSELVALTVDNIQVSRYGLRIYLPHSKTDAQGAGAWIDIVRAERYPLACPVEALNQWLAVAKITEGRIFRRLTHRKAAPIGDSLSAVSVDTIVKNAAEALGLDRMKYGGHSFRAGKATYLARMNKPPALVAKHGRWKSMDMVLRYYRDETAEGLAGVY